MFSLTWLNRNRITNHVFFGLGIRFLMYLWLGYHKIIKQNIHATFAE